ncbi:Nramp family divalent metal transporter [Rhodoplanes sp. Z2-YC6860]|uniref:Nramp family divalent metal transporter n=1 Tax=Rhodoplanes sp. Z2-YC6860 TaxID=674703 RepID=UPI00078CAFD6|nr:Nramp family divalent metal transporter [Rhodoplanes sp. Z2-YC6860]AMN39616.1 Mn2+/Fe2+ transporter, NRAMP family [Rhodoplanes sp. Z2-YC6860]
MLSPISEPPNFTSTNKANWSDRTRLKAQATLAGQRRGLRAFLPFVGPAVVASVAYMDPGNFATNIQSGAALGYELLWVVLFANVTAMLFQSLSAKLGIATGRNLTELCREHFSRPTVAGMWAISEIAAMATDLAEFLGATIALHLLFGIPLLAGMLFTAVTTYLMLLLEGRGFRPIEALISALVGVMAGCYVLEVLLARPDWGLIAYHSAVPTLSSRESVVLAVGVIGATVMPHAIYLHSDLTKNRIVPNSKAQAREIVRWSNREIVLALSFAGAVNMAMMIMAAAVFHGGGHQDVATIETAYHTLTPLLGGASAAVFLIALLASGLSSSVVGTMAGQVVMQGFTGLHIPLWIRRAVTMVPPVLVIAAGYSPTQALVLSQVVLCLALPVPVIPLIMLTRRTDLMGDLANSRLTTAVAIAATIGILILNAILLWSVVAGG